MARIFSARVIGGVIVADGFDLPDGTDLTIAANDSEAEVDLTPEELAELDAAIANADDHDGIDHADVMAELDRLLDGRP